MTMAIYPDSTRADDEVDVVVVGGGMVGAACALAMMTQTDLRVALIEPRPPQPEVLQSGLQEAPDLRVSAINAGSQNWLDELGAWSHIKALRVHPYRRLSVWEHLSKSSFMHERNRVLFESRLLGLHELGFMIENRYTQWGIWQALAPFIEQGRCVLPTTESGLSACELVDVRDHSTEHSRATVLLGAADSNETLSIDAYLVVGADGAHSQVRELAGIATNVSPYKQKVLAVGVELAQPSGDETWQAFQASGPSALLPLSSVANRDGSLTHYGLLIWYDDSARVDELLQQPLDALQHAVEAHFPATLPTITRVYSRAAFDIAKRHAKHYSAKRCVLMGDAAHTINPLAGQGVNLGFQDAKAFVQQLQQLLAKGSLDDDDLLRAFKRGYESKRRRKNNQMAQLMDVFYYSFSNRVAPFKVLRNAFLGVAQKTHYLKREVLKRAAGLD